MNKKLTKPYNRNIRLDNPCGLIGVPPDALNVIGSFPGRPVIILTDEAHLSRWLWRRSGTGFPQ